MSEHEEAIWKLLWDYIAHPSPDEEYSYAMAERLCESVLPLVWNEVGKLEALNAGLLEALEFVQGELSDMTTEQFSRGADKLARDRIDEAIQKASES